MLNKSDALNRSVMKILENAESHIFELLRSSDVETLRSLNNPYWMAIMNFDIEDFIDTHFDEEEDEIDIG